jgi:hypothetical protein
MPGFLCRSASGITSAWTRAKNPFRGIHRIAIILQSTLAEIYCGNLFQDVHSQPAVALLTNSRQLLAEQSVEYARTSNFSLHQHHTGMIAHDLANNPSFPA